MDDGTFRRLGADDMLDWLRDEIQALKERVAKIEAAQPAAPDADMPQPGDFDPAPMQTEDAREGTVVPDDPSREDDAA